MNLDEFVVVRTYPGEAIAGIAASRLGSEGIEAFIRKDDVGGAYPALQMTGGVRLLVKPEDLANAERILNEMDAEEVSDEAEQEEQPEDEDQKKEKSGLIVSIGLLLLGFAGGYFLAPEITHRSTYTGVVNRHQNEKGTPGAFGHYVDSKLTRFEEDRNYDGKIDAWYKYVAGKLRTGTFDNNFDGRPDVWVEYKDQFNSVERVDTDFDGKPDTKDYYVNGLMQKRDWHPNDSPIIERRQFFEHGVLKEELVDTDRNGKFDLKITYDPFERPIEKTKIP